jgi:hypothetical protein
MSLLEGILGGAQTSMAFNQQRTTNKLNRDKFDEQKRQYDQSYDENVRQFNLNDRINQDANRRLNAKEGRDAKKAGIEAVTATNDKYYETLDVGGYIAQDRMSLNIDKIRQGIENGDGQAIQLVLGFATQFGNLPEGSVAESVKALPEGGYAVTVRNADGSMGVVTEDGSRNPNAAVVRFEAGQLGKLANTQFQREVLTNTTKFDPTTMRTTLNLIDADSKKQAVNDQDQDFLAEKQYEKQVVDTAKQTGSVELVRGVEGAIAAGGPEATAAIGADLGVPKPTVSTDDSEPAPQPTAPTAPTEPTEPTEPSEPTEPWSLESVDRGTTGGRLIRNIEGAGNRNKNPLGKKADERKGSDWFKNQQTEKLMARKEQLEKQVAAGPKGDRRYPMNPAVAGRLHEEQKRELEQINAYVDKDKPALFAADPATDAVAEQAAGKTTEQIAEGVNAGTIKVDQATVQTVAEKLRREGIKEIRDLKRLSAKDSAIARAAIIASSPDATIRERMLQEIVNIFDNPYNSPSVSKKDMLSLQDSAADRTYKYKNLANDIAKTRRSWNDAANKEASDVLAGALEIFYGPTGEDQFFDYDSAAKFLRGKPFNKFNIWLKQSDRTDEEIANAMPGMAATLSLTLAAMAGEESGGIRESVIDFISRDEVEDSTDPADFDVSRIRVDDTGVDENGKSKATKIYYTDEDGNILDEEGGLQALKDLHPEMYRNALQIAIYNTRKANGE